MAMAGEKYFVGRESREQYGEPMAGNAQGQADGQVQGYNFRLVMTTVTANRIAPSAPAGYRREDFTGVLVHFASGKLKKVFSENTDAIYRADPALPNHKADVNDTPGAPVRLSMPDVNAGYPDGDAATRAHRQRASLLQRRPALLSPERPRCPDSPSARMRASGAGARTNLRKRAASPRSCTSGRPGAWSGSMFSRAMTRRRRPTTRGPCCASTALPSAITSITVTAPLIPARASRASIRVSSTSVCRRTRYPMASSSQPGLRTCSLPSRVRQATSGFAPSAWSPSGARWDRPPAGPRTSPSRRMSPFRTSRRRRCKSCSTSIAGATIYLADVAPDSPRFAAAQWFGTHGAFHGLLDPKTLPLPRPQPIGGQYNEAFPGHFAELDKPIDADRLLKWRALAQSLGARNSQPSGIACGADPRRVYRSRLRTIFAVVNHAR